MAAVIGALRAELSAQIAEFVKGMDTAAAKTESFRKRFSAVGKSMQKAGAVMSAAVTAPLVALAATSLDDFQQQEDAIAGLEASLKSTGGTVGVTSQQLQDMATQLQKVTRYADEDILGNATGSLLKFTNVVGPEFIRANALVLDVATGMKTDLAGAANLLGKALNDPLKGLKALRSMGITFTDDQKAVLKSLVETGQMAKAQAMIMDEVVKRFGGQAEAAANTSAGGIDKLKNQWGEVKEKIGAVAAQVLPPLIDMLGKLVDWINTLDPATVAWVAKIATIAVVVGPVIGVIGTLMTTLAALPAVFSAVAAAASAVGVAITLMGGPVTIAIVAIAALASAWYLYGDQIKAKAQEIYTAIDETTGGKLTTALTASGQAVAGFAQYFKAQAVILYQIITGDFGGAFTTFKQMWVDLWTSFTTVLDTAFPGLTTKVTDFCASMLLTFQTWVASVIQYFMDMKTQVIAVVTEMVDAVAGYFTEKLDAALSAVQEKIKAVTDAFAYMYDAVVGHSYVPDMVDGISAHFGRLSSEMVDPAKAATQQVQDSFSHIVDSVSGLLDKLLSNGKITFGDLKKAALDLAKTLFIQPFFNGLKSGFGGAGTGGGGGIGGLLGGVFGKLFQGGFAKGGTIPAGTWGMVGEQGPEPIFAGRKDLTVIPNSGGQGGGGNNFYIQTPDPVAFRDNRVAMIRGAAKLQAQAGRHS